MLPEPLEEVITLEVIDDGTGTQAMIPNEITSVEIVSVPCTSTSVPGTSTSVPGTSSSKGKRKVPVKRSRPPISDMDKLQIDVLQLEKERAELQIRVLDLKRIKLEKEIANL